MSNRSEDFQLLFERYYRSIHFFFTNRGFSKEDARDLTQETFLRAYKGVEAFRNEASYKTWLFRIASNIWRNAIRSRNAAKRDAKEVSLEEHLEGGRPVPPDSASRERGSPLSQILTDEAILQLQRALNDLPAQMRRCVKLRLFQELKYREIAELLQLSIETVKSQLHQARQRLREQLRGYFDDIEF